MVAELPIPLHPRLETDAAARDRAAFDLLGPASLADDQVLALLVGGRNPLPVARRLLDRFDGVRGLADAPLEALAAHVGERRAAALVGAFELARRRAEAIPDRRTVRTPADIAEWLMPAMRHLDHEQLRVVVLNSKNAVVATRTVYVGNLAGSSVRVGEVYREAVRRQAAALVVVHNHPSGDPTPSHEDLAITGELAEAGRLLDVELLDHLVLGDGEWASLRALGAIRLSRPG